MVDAIFFPHPVSAANPVDTNVNPAHIDVYATSFYVPAWEQLIARFDSAGEK